MKQVVIGAVAFLVIFGTTSVAGDRGVTVYHYGDRDDDSRLDAVNIDLDGDVVVLEHEHLDNGPVEITKDHRLLVDGKEVKLDAEQERMVGGSRGRKAGGNSDRPPGQDAADQL
jgi:hypothetical protein